ncbi:MAG TPA: EamA family transporter [Verrucomicrobiae bacterium]|nr:EamA family transporter [Verrucomicrobiae bacterium]
MTWIHWSLLSAFFAGITAVLAKASVSDTDANLATAIRTTVALALAWAIAAATTDLKNLAAIPTRTWTLLTLSGLATGASWLCYFRALQLGDASRVGPIDKLSVVFVIFLAAVFLHEVLTWRHYVGGVLILAGAVVISSQS